MPHKMVYQSSAPWTDRDPLSPVGAEGLGMIWVWMFCSECIAGMTQEALGGAGMEQGLAVSSGVTSANTPPRSPWGHRAPKHCQLLPCSPRAKVRELLPYKPPGSINIPLKSKRLLTFVNRLLKMIITSWPSWYQNRHATGSSEQSSVHSRQIKSFRSGLTI